MRRWHIGRQKLAARTVTHLAKSKAQCCLSITWRITSTLNSAANQANSLALLSFRFWRKFIYQTWGERTFVYKGFVKTGRPGL
jgi:hypothetical protein